MTRLLAIRLTPFLLFIGLMTQSCTDDNQILPLPDNGDPITNRTVVGDSIFQLHNDFILWLYDNYDDSLFYYSDDVVEFMEFVSKKRYVYNGETVDLGSLVLDDDTLIISAPYYVEGTGFTQESGAYNAAEYDSLYVVLDSVYNAFDDKESEATIQSIISRGQTRISAAPVSTHPNQDAVYNALTQASYSVALIHDLEAIYGGLYIDPCVFVAAYADVSLYQYFEELGDTDPESPMYSFAMTGVAGASAYAYATCP